MASIIRNTNLSSEIFLLGVPIMRSLNVHQHQHEHLVDHPQDLREVLPPDSGSSTEDHRHKPAELLFDHQERSENTETKEIRALQAQLAEQTSEIESMRLSLNEANQALARMTFEIESHVLEFEQEARIKGYELGFEEGKKKGEESAREQLEIEIRRIHELVANLSRLDTEMVAAVEDRIFELVFEATCKILGPSFIERDAIKSVIDQLIEKSNGVPIYRLRLNPLDYAKVASMPWAENNNQISNDKIEFQPDESIVVGGCVLDGERGALEARLDVRLREFLKILVKSRTETL